jgi:peptidoglycan hydrolase-like protein with peptidoglycan-binding domain
VVASQNGWRANDRSVWASRQVPGTTRYLTVHIGPAGDVLLEVAGLFDALVEDIDAAFGTLDDWGGAERVIRGGYELSNHASATAIDLNALRHALGVPASRSFTATQIATIHRILALTVVDGKQVVRWGGDYDNPSHGGVAGSRPDSMHFEINDGITEEQCARALVQLRAGGHTAVPAAPKPAPAQPWLNLPDMRSGHASTGTQHWQQWYNLYQFKPALLPIIKPTSTNFGPQTEAAVKKVQARYGLVADGIVGPLTKKLFWRLGFRG